MIFLLRWMMPIKHLCGSLTDMPVLMAVAAGSDVDIVPQRAGKGRALEFLLKEMRAAGMEPEEGVQVIQHTHT